MTATEIDTTTQASDDTVTQAVRDARTASEWWAELTFEQRARRLDRWRGIIARRASELADVVHRDMGKPHPDAMLEIAMALEHLAWASKNARKVLGRRSVRSSFVDGQSGRLGGVSTSRGDRCDRSVELSGLHPTRFALVLAGCRQRRGLQAE